jgi:hypothetical protein
MYNVSRGIELKNTIGCLILATCHASKVRWVQKVEKSISENDIFDEKVLAVDEFNNMFFPARVKKYFEEKGWKVIIDNHKSRTKSMLNGLAELSTDYVFYSEDDVLVDLPSKEFILDNLKHKIGDLECGMLSLNLGGTTSTISNMGGSNSNTGSKNGDLDFAKENMIIQNDTSFSFRRLEEKRNAWFYEFPGLFMPRELMADTINKSKEKFKGMQIEMALTSAWFYFNFDKKYYKASVAKNNLLDILEKNPLLASDNCRHLTNLDKTQGAFVYGGNPSL